MNAVNEKEPDPEKKAGIFPLVEFSVSRRVSITMLILIVMVFGMLSLSRLPLDMLPDITFPMVTVVTQYEGVAPEEIERMVTVPLEGVIASVNRVKKVSSQSLEGYSSISVEFEWGTNLDYAAQDIKDNIDQIKPYLPEGIKEPMVFKFNMSQMPVLMVGVTGIEDAYKLKKLLEDNVRERLQRLDGVAQVLVYGGKQREITIACDPVRLRAKGQNIEAINNMLYTQNLNTPAGYLTKSNTDYLLRAMGEFRSIDDIRNIIIGVAPDNRTPVRLYEVAEVRDTYKEKRSLIRINGKESVFLIMMKQSGANTLNVSRKLVKEMEAVRTIYPQLEFYTFWDQGKPVARVTGSTTRDIVIGYVFVIFILLIFLGNLRPTLIIAIAVPLSIITTFIVLYLTGFTLNLMTLGGLALGVGRLVDDAVVVIENIYRHLENGEPPVEAARKGASEVSMAISASTFTTIIVFLPLTFSQGIAQQLTRGFSLTIAFTLLASLFVAFTIVPMLSSVFFRKPKKESAQWFNTIKNRYGRWLESVLRRPGLTLWAVAITMLLSIGVGVVFVGREFMPKQDNAMMLLNLEMPIGTTLDETAAMCTGIEKVLMSYPEATYVGEIVGVDESQMGDPGGAAISGPNGAQIFVMLKDPEDRKRSQQEIEDLVRARLPELRNGKITIMSMSGFNMGSGKPIKINIYGNNLSTLADISNNIIEVIRTVPGLHDVESSFSKARPEYHFVIDRQKALLFGLTPYQVQKAIEAANLGTVFS
ncbi:MAG: efflux RND transporter permease subunit, partial [Chitinispirillaceae bacterium]|nr:efflux RND transporter permease subunit [Chitinispirillaceae bacterium]